LGALAESARALQLRAERNWQMLKRVIALVDGENLVLRYQAMLADGGGKLMASRKNAYRKDVFVWNRDVTKWTDMDLRRVSYFSSLVGNDERIEEVEEELGKTPYVCRGAGYSGTGTIIPRVYKRRQDGKKSRVVDIGITIDFMNALDDPQIDAIFLLSGDGDFLHLVKEARRTSKQVHIGAFSSGLDPSLRRSADQFVNLDSVFFETSA
jgi:uncharacterized LabA/DUF88 family protein